MSGQLTHLLNQQLETAASVSSVIVVNNKKGIFTLLPDGLEADTVQTIVPNIEAGMVAVAIDPTSLTLRNSSGKYIYNYTDLLYIIVCKNNITIYCKSRAKQQFLMPLRSVLALLPLHFRQANGSVAINCKEIRALNAIRGGSVTSTDGKIFLIGRQWLCSLVMDEEC